MSETEVGSRKSEVGKTPEWQPEIQKAPTSDFLGGRVSPARSRTEGPGRANPPLLDLSTPERIVFLNAAGRRFKHVFRPPREADWLEYDRALKPTITEQADGSTESNVALVKAAADLWFKLILRVEGYPSENWKDPMPLNHRGTAVLGLSQVAAAEDPDVLGDSERIAVVLEARWNGESFSRLVHWFNRPTIEHELRYSEGTRRFARRVMKVGGERKPKAARTQLIQLPNLPTVVALYDELIESVEGYVGAGLKPAPTGEMDLWHKSAAIHALFDSQGNAELEPIEPLGEKDAG